MEAMWDAEVTRTGMFGVISAAWKSADESTRAKYQQQAEEERERESAERGEEGESEGKKSGRKRRESEGETNAKRRRTFRELTGSMLFCQEHREEAAEKSREGRGVESRPRGEGGQKDASWIVEGARCGEKDRV